MEKPLLNDSNLYPSDAVLSKYLGRAKLAWDALAAAVDTDYPGAALEWRYYKDGNAWLCKLTRKKKTLCWLSVWDKAFKVTFYFTEKNRQAIAALPISEDLKEQYLAQRSTMKLQPLTLLVRSKKALADVHTLVGFKGSLK